MAQGHSIFFLRRPALGRQTKEMAASDLEGSTMEDTLVAEGSIMRTTNRSLRSWAGALVPLLGAAVIVLAIVATRSPTIKTESGADVISMEQMVVQKPLAMCSNTWTGDPEDDCSETKCCKTSGFSCYEKKPGTYGCLETCDPAKGWTCQMPNFIVPLSEVKYHSRLDVKLYCFAVYTKVTGSTKKSHELELLQQQYQKKVSLFSCDHYDVFSDGDAEVGSGYPAIKVTDNDHEFRLIKRKKTGTWVNTGMFKQVWKAIAQKPEIKEVQWVVKVDADAIFFPHRLKGMLQGHPITYTGIYLENCNEVKWGFFGNLEVFSVEAFNTLLNNIDSCSKSIDWVKGTKFGPIGEDLFALMCMDRNGVSKVQNFDLTTDGVCPGTKKRWGAKNATKWKPPCNLVGTPAIHPFKKPEEYLSCYEATMTFG